MTALSFILLTITGVILHFGDPEGTVVDYDAATILHDVAGIAMFAVYGVYLAFVIGTGYWRHDMPVEKVPGSFEGSGNLLHGRFGPQRAPCRADHGRPVQRPATADISDRVFALLPLLVVTGLLYLYYPAFVPETVLGLAGFWPLALAHYALGILSAAYLVVHA
jgi:thiosulfate reductase cytochrome b subunit